MYHPCPTFPELPGVEGGGRTSGPDPADRALALDALDRRAGQGHGHPGDSGNPALVRVRFGAGSNFPFSQTKNPLLSK